MSDAFGDLLRAGLGVTVHKPEPVVAVPVDGDTGIGRGAAAAPLLEGTSAGDAMSEAVRRAFARRRGYIDLEELP